MVPFRQDLGKQVVVMGARCCSIACFTATLFSSIEAIQCKRRSKSDGGVLSWFLLSCVKSSTRTLLGWFPQEERGKCRKESQWNFDDVVNKLLNRYVGCVVKALSIDNNVKRRKDKREKTSWLSIKPTIHTKALEIYKSAVLPLAILLGKGCVHASISIHCVVFFIRATKCNMPDYCCCIYQTLALCNALPREFFFDRDSL